MPENSTYTDRRRPDRRETPGRIPNRPDLAAPPRAPPRARQETGRGNAGCVIHGIGSDELDVVPRGVERQLRAAIATHPTDLIWWPFWNLGIPFENTYLPLLHVTVAAFSGAIGVSRSMHLIALLDFVHSFIPSVTIGVTSTASEPSSIELVGH